MKVVGIDPGTAPSTRLRAFEKRVCGYGRAEKTQVQRMRQVLLGRERTPTPSTAADALAICHALARRLRQATG